MTEQIKVSGLFIYPVKSLGGISLEAADLGKRGFKYDREWMIVDADNRFVSQREIARMALIGTAIDQKAGCLRLSLPSTAEEAQAVSTKATEVLEIALAINTPGDTTEVKVWDDLVLATLESDAINKSLSSYLGAPVRLVRMGADYKRKVDPHYAPELQDIVGFADGFPILVIGEESLEDLNERLEYPVLMNRFRPNITTSGAAAFAEDNWQQIKIGDIRLNLVKPCARCSITTVDQEAGVAGKEPLRTLANFRKINGKIMFGQNAIFRGEGTVRLGAEVIVGDAN